MKKLLRIVAGLAIVASVLLGAYTPVADATPIVPVQTEPEWHYGYTPPVVTQKSLNNFDINFTGTKAKVAINTTQTSMSISAFDGECNIGLTLATSLTRKSLTNGTLTGTSESSVIRAGNTDVEYTYKPTVPTQDFNEYGGFDLLIKFNKPPPSNSINFTYDSTNVEAYLQPPLTQAEIAEGSIRPDHVVNSIAFYHASKGGTVTVADANRGITTGKIGHLYRMQVTDAKGAKTWADWGISGSLLTLTIDQKFLDKAVYPVIISPVGDFFGWSSYGASSDTIESQMYGSRFVISADGTGVSITVGSNPSTTSKTFTCQVYDNGSGDNDVEVNKIANGVTDQHTPAGTGQAWRTATFTVAPTFTSGTSYRLLVVGKGGSGTHVVYYDAAIAGAYGYRQGSLTYPTFPDPANVSALDEVRVSIYCTYTPSAGNPPTVTTDAATDKEDTTATLNGTVTDDDGETIDYYGFVWDTVADAGDPGDSDPSVPPAGWEYGWKSASGNYGENPFSHAVTSLPTGTTIYFRAAAHNTNGWAYGAGASFLTKPAAPTNVAATDGTSETKVVITWTKSTGATNYHVWRGAADLGAAGDVATFDDSGATAGTITNSGVATASDGTSTAHVTLSLAGEAKGYTSHTYKVVASNATGNSDDSATDTGYRVCGAITYQWQEDSGGWANIAGGTTDPYNDTAAGAPTVTAGVCTASNGTSTAHVTLSIAGELGNNGATRNYRCVVSSTNASNSPQNSTENTGYRGTAALTYQWRVSAGDADAGYGNLAGATTDPHNDATAPAPTVTPGVATASDGISNTHVVLSIAGAVGNNGEGRLYYCQVSMVDATTQDTNHDRGYRGIALLTYEWFRSAADADAAFASIAVEGGTFIPYNDPNGATDPDGRWYYCTVSMADAADQDTDHDRGYMTAGGVGAAVYLPFPLLVPFATETIRRLFRRRRNG